MAEQITYYALIDDYSSHDEPGGVVRRVRNAEGQHDEAFGPGLRWQFTSLLYSAERGDTTNDFYEISKDEAMRIVDRIQRDADERLR